MSESFEDFCRIHIYPMANFLHPLPRQGPFCAHCWGIQEDPDFETCYSCKKIRESLGYQVSDLVVPVAIAVKGEQFYRFLYNYKRSGNPVDHWKVSALIITFLRYHANCIGFSNIDYVCCVPSKTAGGESVLEQVLSTKISWSKPSYLKLLEFVPGSYESRTPSPTMFRSSYRLDGLTVLLIEDTWVTGATPESAAFALKAAGAAKVITLVFGRCENRSFRRNAEILDASRRLPYSFEVCRLCSVRTIPHLGNA